MKAMIGLLVFGFVIYLWVRFIRFIGAIFKVVNTPKPLPTKPVSRSGDSKRTQAGSQPREVRPEIVASDFFDEESQQSLERSIDRQFEGMGLELRFAHLPKAAKQMLKKAWTGRKLSESDEEEPILLDRLYRGISAREAGESPGHGPIPLPAASAGESMGMIWQTDDLQKAFVFSEILAPPIALREE